MAAVVAPKPQLPLGKMKKPSLPSVQTGVNGTKPAPSASPSSAVKRLPGQQPSTPATASSSANTNGVPRPARRPPRATTRTNTLETTNMDRRSARKYPEPYVSSESHILKKFRGSSPSLIVHLHPTHFRFEQQDGSFSYHSEMRLFIEHLAKRTIPHDMLEEFRKSEVKFYDGWLIVRVVDHKSVARAVAANNANMDDEKAGSIHNYTPYITPSPYAPFPSKDQTASKSPKVKHEPSSKSETEAQPETKPSRPEPQIYHVALRPTNMSRHMDLVIDAMTPDPKALQRRQSQANSRAPAPGVSQTPLTAVPPTPAAEKGPPLKKQKMKIDARDLLEYEARIINATAPPLYLEPARNLEEVDSILTLLHDPLHDHEPPSPKSRMRTVAELAADDAHAKEQERFMQIMDTRVGAASSGANAATVDGQAAANLFQPRFEKWIVLQNIRKDLADKKAAEDLRRMNEDRERRQEAEQRRVQLDQQQKRQAAMERRQAEISKQQQLQAHQQQRAAVQMQPRTGGMPQPNGVPPNMQEQMMASSATQRSSPIIRSGTPMMNSSPMQPQGVPMAASASGQGGAGSPPRPGSAIPHAHSGIPMARVPSGQGPSRNGTPQIPNSTPGMIHSTPILRQGTPNSRMTQTSPHANMMVPTSQMGQAGLMAPNHMVNGIPMNPQQVAMMHQRHQMMQQQAAMSQQGMPNGNPHFAQSQMAHMQAQRHAQLDQQNAMLRLQQQQQQPLMQQQPPNMPQQSQHRNVSQYQADLMKQMQSQIQQIQSGQQSDHGSPMPNNQQHTPQQQAQQLANIQQQQRQAQAMAQAQAQAQQQNQMPNGIPNPQQQQQQRPQQNSPVYKFAQQYAERLMTSTANEKYGGNIAAIPPQEQQALKSRAVTHAQQQLASNMQKQAQVQARMMAQHNQQQGGGGNMQNTQVQPNNIQQYLAMQHAQQNQTQGVGNGGQQLTPAQQQMLHQQMMQRQQQAMMQQMQQQQQQQQVGQGQVGGGNGAGGGGGGMNMEAQASAQAYQQQLAQIAAQMQQQQQQQ